MTAGAVLLGHAASLARRLDSTGADLARPQVVLTSDGLTAEGRIDAEFPGAGRPARATITFRQTWGRPFADQPWHLREYRYDLVDRDRDFRRAFHHHDQDWFVSERLTVVHEHCERPIGNVACHHYSGAPVADGFEGIDRLLTIWTDDHPPDCSTLACLD